MKAVDANFLDILGISRVQYTVPIFQRTYSWGIKECRQLWNDTLSAGRPNREHLHFLGSIVYITEGTSPVTDNSQMQIIDGQQRLTSVSLLLEALARYLKKGEEPVDGFSVNKIRNYYLLNSEEEDERRYKLILSKADKETFKSIIDQSDVPRDYSNRIVDNFEYFEKELNSSDIEIETLCRGLRNLRVVDITLERGKDNPQLIFESLNSKGLALSKADLIRNYVLMDLEQVMQKRLYNNYWRPMEDEFGQNNYREQFDSFIRYYLTVKNSKLPKKAEVYNDFKKHAVDRGYSSETAESVLGEVKMFSKYYCNIALGHENNTLLSVAFSDLRELVAEVAYPLMLQIYCDYDNGLINTNEVIYAIRLIESYVFRRAVCGYKPNPMNKIFASFAAAIDNENYIESLETQFLSLGEGGKFPGDEEFIDQLINRDIYDFKRIKYLMRRLENYERKESVVISDYSIEHIMPQNENLSDEWKQSLGSDWQHIHSKYLHTLGNLTLTGYNSEYSDKPFSEKRDMEGGFSKSPLELNSDLRNIADWNEANIINRADRLAKIAVKVWPYPSLPVNKPNS